MKYFIDPATGNLFILDPNNPADAALIAQLTAEGYPETTLASYENKKQAQELLYKTDWTTIADVADSTKSNPYLGNPNDFVTYRSAIRAIAVTAPDSAEWPAMPTAEWLWTAE